MGVAAYSFRNVSLPDPGPDGRYMVETRIGIESATDFEKETNIIPKVNLVVYNRDTGKTSPPTSVAVESLRITRTPVPAEFVRGGNFDVFLAGLNESMWYSVDEAGLSVVRSQRSFALNLATSMFILWLMAVLAGTIGAASGVIGLYVSWYQQVASGAAIVLAATALFFIAWLFAPRAGVITPRVRHARHRPRPERRGPVDISGEHQPS